MDTDHRTENRVADVVFPYPDTALTIKSWAEGDRPREKLMQKGSRQLSDAELLAILLGSGTRSETAVGLAQRLMNFVGNDLHELGRRSVRELTAIKGIGQAKAIAIAAALEVGRRRHAQPAREPTVIRSSEDAFTAMAAQLFDLGHEEFWILLLNRGNHIIGKEQISIGGVHGTVVDAKIVFKKALQYQASAMILYHNHPSGSLDPSPQDIELTRKLTAAGKTLDINILDHLIITDKGYFSFTDHDLIS
ncbi:MAG TPA: DNA repair protein RadC [Flavilitoribacter sp.]|nr:DNA repair protein RadC [Flavilitoribacter sp.]HMQ89594.1 DNA repair protein RadC [Flavilitoribacter sp.]